MEADVDALGSFISQDHAALQQRERTRCMLPQPETPKSLFVLEPRAPFSRSDSNEIDRRDF